MPYEYYAIGFDIPKYFELVATEASAEKSETLEMELDMNKPPLIWISYEAVMKKQQKPSQTERFTAILRSNICS